VRVVARVGLGRALLAGISRAHPPGVSRGPRLGVRVVGELALGALSWLAFCAWPASWCAGRGVIWPLRAVSRWVSLASGPPL